jgi:multicomponent Na+:H+ antiporter subunit F
MKLIKWSIGAVALAGAVALILIRPLPFLFYPDLPYVAFFGRGLYILLLASMLCLYRIVKGPTGADRVVASDMLGVMIVGLCALLTVTTGRSWYIDIGIAWALQSFISGIAYAKYLEGKGFEE